MHSPEHNGNPFDFKTRNAIKMWKFPEKRLLKWIDDLDQNDIKFIALERNFFRPKIFEVLSTSNEFVTSLRDPYERYMSEYNILGGDKRFTNPYSFYNYKLMFKRTLSTKLYPIKKNNEFGLYPFIFSRIANYPVNKIKRKLKNISKIDQLP